MLRVVVRRDTRTHTHTHLPALPYELWHVIRFLRPQNCKRCIAWPTQTTKLDSTFKMTSQFHRTLTIIISFTPTTKVQPSICRFSRRKQINNCMCIFCAELTAKWTVNMQSEMNVCVCVWHWHSKQIVFMKSTALISIKIRCDSLCYCTM